MKISTFHPDYHEDYADAKEDILAGHFPESFGEELNSSIFWDADHAHDIKTRRSISGILGFIGSTPVFWKSTRQGCIATSTYCSEFIAKRTAVEEAISMRYMLCCFGIPVTKPTRMYGDNRGVIDSVSIPQSELKKRHIAISYHFVREAIAAKIIDVTWIASNENYADILTKDLGRNQFYTLLNELME